MNTDSNTTTNDADFDPFEVRVEYEYYQYAGFDPRIYHREYIRLGDVPFDPTNLLPLLDKHPTETFWLEDGRICRPAFFKRAKRISKRIEETTLLLKNLTSDRLRGVITVQTFDESSIRVQTVLDTLCAAWEASFRSPDKYLFYPGKCQRCGVAACATSDMICIICAG